MPAESLACDSIPVLPVLQSAATFLTPYSSTFSAAFVLRDGNFTQPEDGMRAHRDKSAAAEECVCVHLSVCECVRRSQRLPSFTQPIVLHVSPGPQAASLLIDWRLENKKKRFIFA